MTEELSKPTEMNGISKSLGIDMTEFGNGAATFNVVVGKNHLNKGGVAFGGLHASLLDSAMGAALVSTLKVSEWCAAVKKHPSTSKEDIVPYTCLPTKEDIDSGVLRNVGINVV